jgi:hypothetical protein
MRMTLKITKSENLQPGLFDQEEPHVALKPAQKARLTTLVEALLIEIAASIATGEARNEQDRR